jgi:hypothetical protein
VRLSRARFLAVAWLCCVGLGLARLALAEPAPIRAHIELEAGTSCGDSALLVARVQRRSSRIEAVPPSADVIGFRALVRALPRGLLSATLDVEPPGGKRSTREIVARSCDEAVDALALVIAITLDPEAETVSTVAERDRTEGQPPAPSTAPSAPSEASDSKRRAKAADPKREAESSPPGPASPIAPALESARWRARLTSSARFESVSGPAPALLNGFAIQALLDLEHARSVWSPAIALSAGYQWVGGLHEPGGTADFALSTANISLCPLQIRPISQFAARFCGSAGVGALFASGRDTYRPRSPTRPYAELGGALLLSAFLTEKVELSGLFAGERALILDTFQFSPERFHRVSPVTLRFGLGLGFRIPVIE